MHILKNQNFRKLKRWKLNTHNALSYPPSQFFSLCLMTSASSSPCRRLLPASSSPSLGLCAALAPASPQLDLPFRTRSLPAMPDDPPAAPSPAADGSPSPADDPRSSHAPTEPSPRKTRLPRACTSRPRAAAASALPPPPERRLTRREKEAKQQVGRVITTLVEPPSPPQLPRWELRSMWELASILNFLHVGTIFSSFWSFFDQSLFDWSLRVALLLSCLRFLGFQTTAEHCCGVLSEGARDGAVDAQQHSG